MKHIITLNVDAVYTGYYVDFTYSKYDYSMKVKTGNRGSMTIRLISIDQDMKTYQWSYVHKDDVYTSKFESITREVSK